MGSEPLQTRILLYIGLIASLTLAHGWKLCLDEEGGGVCPNGNKCCSTGVKGVSSCVAEPGHKFNGTAMCCPDNTGCAPGYECALLDGVDAHFVCRLYAPPTEDPAPPILPRYKNCMLVNANLQLHGLTVSKTASKLAYFSSLGSLEDDTSIHKLQLVTHVLIDVHGSDRNADNYFCTAIASVPSGLVHSTLVIAPWFMAPQDEPPGVPYLSFLRWNETGPIPHTWRYGAEANDGITSSYQAMDRMIEKIVFDEYRFPNLCKVIIAGHSAGGQFTHRWALTSSAAFWGDTADQNSTNRHVPLRVVAANPRSFSYLDDRRYNKHGQLVKPRQWIIDTCPGYNGWEWGLELNGRVPMPRHLVTDIEDHGGDVTWLINAYSKRDLVYLAGSLDILKVRSECEDDLFQGKNRFDRSDRYYNSLQEVYGTPTHQRLVVKGVPHDHTLMFQSSAGQQAMFGEFQWDSEWFLQRTKQNRSDLWDLTDY